MHQSSIKLGTIHQVKDMTLLGPRGVNTSQGFVRPEKINLVYSTLFMNRKAYYPAVRYLDFFLPQTIKNSRAIETFFGCFFFATSLFLFLKLSSFPASHHHFEICFKSRHPRVAVANFTFVSRRVVSRSTFRCLHEFSGSWSCWGGTPKVFFLGGWCSSANG